MKTKRKLLFYKTYFYDFLEKQSARVKKKIAWTLVLIEELEKIPEVYFKHLEGTEGIYEIRIQSDSNIFRVFCFFDKNNIVVVGHGFQKKSQKTPASEIQRAKRIKNEYHENK